MSALVLSTLIAGCVFFLSGCREGEEAVMTTYQGSPTQSKNSHRLAPAHLLCEYRVNPIGIDIAAPRLSWHVESAQRGQRQTAYRILVASDRKSVV